MCGPEIVLVAACAWTDGGKGLDTVSKLDMANSTDSRVGRRAGIVVPHGAQWSENCLSAGFSFQKVVGLSVRALLGVKHSRVGPPPLAQDEAL